jgi:hypothetical protein
MTAALIILFLLLTLFLIAIPIDIYLSDWDNKGWSMILVVPILFCTLYCFTDIGYVEYEPTDYNVETTSFKVFAKTPDALYESERKIDFDEWTQNKPGFIQEEFNHFGSVLRTKFTVNKVENK